jgi:hypothetical protein
MDVVENYYFKKYVYENFHFTKAWDCDRRALCLVKLDWMLLGLFTM